MFHDGFSAAVPSPRRFSLVTPVLAVLLFAAHLGLSFFGLLPQDVAAGKMFASFEAGEMLSAADGPLAVPMSATQELLIDQGGTVTFSDANRLVLGEISRVFFQSLFSREPFDLVAGPVSVRPSGNAVAIVREQSTITVAAIDGGVTVHFLPDNLNELFVPSGFQVTIRAERVTPHLAQLLPTKLLKEFPLSPLTSSPWIRVSAESAAVFRSRMLTAFTLAVQDNPVPPHPESLRAVLRDGLFVAAQTATIDPARRAARESTHATRAREYAIAAFTHGASEIGAAWQAVFSDRLPTSASEELLSRELRALSVLLPSHPAYPLKESFVTTVASARFPEKLSFDLLRSFLDDARRTVATARPRAFAALASYRSVLERLLSRSSAATLRSAQRLLTQERQTLFALIVGDPSFLRVSLFETLTLLEQALEQTVTAQEDLDELRQAFIQDNLRLLAFLEQAVQERRITVPDTIALGNAVMTRSQALRPSGILRAAVNAFFEEELRRAALFIVFLQEPGTSALLGSADFGERFTRFRTERETLVTLGHYLERLQITAVAADDAFSAQRDQAIADFGRLGATIDSLAPHPELPGFVAIAEATLGGVSFSADYDPARRIVAHVQALDQELSTSVALSNLPFLLENIDALARSEQSLRRAERVVSDAASSNFEDVARELVRARLEGAGLVVSLRHIVIADLDRTAFSVEQATLPSGNATPFSFSFHIQDDRASNLILHFPSGDRRVAGAVSLGNLANRVAILLSRAEE